MTTETKTCTAAVAGVQQLRELARRTGYPPTGDAELARLIAAVESAADAVRTHAQASIKERSERDQPRLF
jgi:hypothetical protein